MEYQILPRVRSWMTRPTAHLTRQPAASLSGHPRPPRSGRPVPQSGGTPAETAAEQARGNRYIKSVWINVNVGTRRCRATGLNHPLNTNWPDCSGRRIPGSSAAGRLSGRSRPVALFFDRPELPETSASGSQPRAARGNWPGDVAGRLAAGWSGGHDSGFRRCCSSCRSTLSAAPEGDCS